MSMRFAGRILVRRWYLSLPLLVLVVAAPVLVMKAMPSTYRSQAVVLLLEPPQKGVPTGRNPYLMFDSSLSITAEALGAAAMDGRTAEALHARGLNGTYTVDVASLTGGPFLHTTMTSPTAGAAVKGQQLLLSELDRELQVIQNDVGAPPATRISLSSLAAGTRTHLVLKSKIQAAVAVTIVMLSLLLCLPLLLERLLVRRVPNVSQPAAREPAAREPAAREPAAHRADAQRGPGRPGARDGVAAHGQPTGSSHPASAVPR